MFIKSRLISIAASHDKEKSIVFKCLVKPLRASQDFLCAADNSRRVGLPSWLIQSFS